MHGAGVIEDLEEKQIGEETNLYYVLNIPVGTLKVTISHKKADDLGVRYCCKEEEALDVLNNFNEMPTDIPDNWNKRYEYNMQKVKSGKLAQVLEVYLSSYKREREKSLSGMEKKLLFTAKQAIVSELMVSQNIDRSDAESLLNNTSSRVCPRLEPAV